MTVYIQHNVLCEKVDVLKVELTAWVKECYEGSTVTYREFAIGINSRGEMQLSLPYVVDATGELRYWIEPIYCVHKNVNNNLASNTIYVK